MALDCVWGSLATSTEVMGYSLNQPPCAYGCISLRYIQEEDCWVIDDDKVPRLVVGLRWFAPSGRPVMSPPITLPLSPSAPGLQLPHGLSDTTGTLLLQSLGTGGTSCLHSSAGYFHHSLPSHLHLVACPFGSCYDLWRMILNYWFLFLMTAVLFWFPMSYEICFGLWDCSKNLVTFLFHNENWNLWFISPVNLPFSFTLASDTGTWKSFFYMTYCNIQVNPWGTSHFFKKPPTDT